MNENSSCSDMFCGCETEDDFENQYLEVRVIVSLFWVLLVMLLSVKIGLQWFIFKDYYPLKEKSPILCIILLQAICINLVIYPMIYMVNYFTFFWSDNVMYRTNFRALKTSLQFACHIIYFIRSMRISYAHSTNSKLNKTLSFQIFQKQYLLASLVFAICALRFLIVFVNQFTNDQQQNQDLFKISVQFQIPLNRQQQTVFIWKLISLKFFWQIILIYCLWLQIKINQRYSMFKELIVVIVSDLTISLFYNIYFISNLDALEIMSNMCVSNYFSLSETLNLIYFITICYISIVKPLRQKKIYHLLLPTGRHYGFIKTMRDFLMEEQFLRVFTKYLQYLDMKEESNSNIKLLNFWKQIFILKLNRTTSQQQKIQALNRLLEQLNQILSNQNILILNLKQSIISFSNSINSQESIRQKYRDDINQKIDEVQKIVLQKLDKIYVQKYSMTQSYFHLKEIINDNKRINLNMIMLNLALIVDTQNQFT